MYHTILRRGKVRYQNTNTIYGIVSRSTNYLLIDSSPKITTQMLQSTGRLCHQRSSSLVGQMLIDKYNSTSTGIHIRRHHQRQRLKYYDTSTTASPYSSHWLSGCIRSRDLSLRTMSSISWWNPFSSSKGDRDTKTVVSSARTKSQNESESPRKIQERKDLTLLMLATEFRKISLEKDQKRQEENNNSNKQRTLTSSSTTATGSSSSSSNDIYLESREKLIDLAFDRLAEIDIDSKSVMQLRYSLQSALEEQAMEYFNVFGSIDEELLLLVPENNNNQASEDERITDCQIDSYLDDILRLELERTIDNLANTNRNKAPKGANPKEFLTLKRGAIKTLLNCEGERDEYTDNNTTISNGSDNYETNNNEQNKVSWVEADEFGYHLSVDQEKNRLIRYYQKINVCRSAKMRDNVGYSVIALQSSIPGSGRGVYVDGYARAGSILAFQPGKVFSKENLMNLSVDEERELERNDSYQMSLRPDDFMIDSRRSPYTVLTDKNSNLMALGHIVNHPTPSNPPNARSTMFNFTQGMQSGLPSALRRYIPNTYARKRNKSLMSSLLDQDVIEMHSSVLVATRDVCNEEIFYDYRLASGHLPQWYHAVNDTDYLPDNEENNVDEEQIDKVEK